jgi:ferredoxin
MRYTITEEQLPRVMLDAEIDTIRQMGAVFQLNTAITGEFFNQTLLREYDAVILATGNTDVYPVSEFGLIPGIDGKIADKRSLMTSRPGVFACGNINGEQRMAVRAAAQGRIAAEQADIYLGTGTLRKKFHFNSAFGRLSATEEMEYLKESIPGSRIEPPEGFIAGFSEDLAMREAQRCMHCDCRKPVSCKLRIYADQYGANRRNQLGPARKELQKVIQHDILVYEPEKCIRCGLCVEISAKEEMLGLTYVGRGFDVRIGVPFSETVATALKITAEACILACPTGAMGFKDVEERGPGI